MIDTLSLMTPRIPPGMVKLQEVAREFGVSRVTIHRWIAAGKLKAYEAEGIRETLLKRSELDEFQSRRVREKRPHSGNLGR